MTSANAGNPQSWNRYSYVDNNPLTGTDPSGLIGSHENAQYYRQHDAGVYGNVEFATNGNYSFEEAVHDWWADLTSTEQSLLLPKVTHLKDPSHPTSREINTGRNRFNQLIHCDVCLSGFGRWTSIGRLITARNFVREFGHDSSVWAQIKSIESIGESEMEITTDDGFISAVRETGRFTYFATEPITGHKNSLRELGRTVSDPSMHLVSDGHASGGFGVHWDPSSTFTELSMSEALKDTVFIQRRLYAALRHETEPHATPNTVSEYLRSRGR